MTPPHTEGLKELIEKLEKATGPSYALDCAIYEALMLPDEWFGEKVTAWFGHGTGIYGCNTADQYRHLDCLRASCFTSSIEAALTLVPEGWRWRVERYNTDQTKCNAELAEVGQIRDFGVGIKTRAQATARTPAIALCIAALRARASQ